MQIFGLLPPELARAIGRDVRHRTRTVERDQHDQVFEPVGPHVDQRPAHALAFHLEHADGFAARQRFVGSGIVERDAREIDFDAAPAHELHGGIEDGERREAEEVEFHQAGLLDPFHVELGDRQIRFRIAVERHQFRERPVGDDDAGRVRRSVAMQAFELLRDVERAPDDGLAVARRLQPRLLGNGTRQRHRIGRILRHQLAELVDLAVGHFEHPADVAQHPARLQRAEGDDLRHLVTAVALLDVADHLVAALLAEIDVEIRHRYPLRIEEALEQQAEPDRIEIGDGERIGDERAGAGAASRTDRNALRLGPLDEIGDDQEISGVFHPLDHAEFELQPLLVFLDRVSRRGSMLGDPVLEPGAGAPHQFGRFVDRLAAEREPRQDRFAHARAEGAALRDLDGRCERFGQVGKERRHLGAGLEMMLRGELPTLVVGEEPAFGDADQGIMGLVVLAPGEERLVRGNQRNAVPIGELDEQRFGMSLGLGAVALQLDVEAVPEQLEQRLQPGGGKLALARGDGAVERTGRAAGERKQALRLAPQRGKLEMRARAGRRAEICPRDEPHQAQIALFARGQQHDPRQLGRPHRGATWPRVQIAEIHRQRAADDRLNPRGSHFVGEFQRSEHVVAVGERERRLAIGLGKLRELADRHRAFEQRIGRVHMQVHEAGAGHVAIP